MNYPSFEQMNATQRRLHNAAIVIEAYGDEYCFANLQRDAIAEIQQLRQVEAERDALIAELRQAKKDAERYRWLRSGFSAMGANIDGQHAWAYRRNATLRGPNLDAAIDAAMQQEQQG